MLPEKEGNKRGKRWDTWRHCESWERWAGEKNVNATSDCIWFWITVARIWVILFPRIEGMRLLWLVCTRRKKEKYINDDIL